MRIAYLIALALAACNLPVTQPAVDSSTPAPPPVVGHWNLEGSVTGMEHLWIELDGTFTEAGGPQLGASVSLSPASFLSGGTWTYADPTLTLDDAQTGAHAFGAVIQGFGAVMILTGAHSYRWDRDSTDGGADH